MDRENATHLPVVQQLTEIIERWEYPPYVLASLLGIETATLLAISAGRIGNIPVRTLTQIAENVDTFYRQTGGIQRQRFEPVMPKKEEMPA